MKISMNFGQLKVDWNYLKGNVDRNEIKPNDFYAIWKVLDLRDEPEATQLPEMPAEIRQKVKAMSRVG